MLRGSKKKKKKRQRYLNTLLELSEDRDFVCLYLASFRLVPMMPGFIAE